MIDVLYEWNGSPARDYTLSVYSTMKNFIITNSRNEKKVLFADG